MESTNFYRLWSLFYGYKKYFAISVVLSLISSIMTLIIPAMSAELINNGIVAGDVDLIVEVGINMLMAAIIAGVCLILNAIISVWAGEFAAHSLRVQEYRIIQTFSHGNMDRFRSSDLLIRLTTDVLSVKNAVMQSVMNLFQVPFLLIGTLIIVGLTNPSLLRLMIILLILLSVILVLFILVVQPKYRIKQGRIDAVTRTLRENLAGIRVVKAFVNQGYEIEKFGTVSQDLRFAALIPQYYLALLIPGLSAILFLGTAGVYYGGGADVISGSGMQIGDVTSAGQYLIFLLIPIFLIAIVLPLITSANASLTRIYHVLDEEPDIKPPLQPVSIDPSLVLGKIIFEQVGFGYLDQDKKAITTVLSDINLTIEPGETIGILGSTGCGKTSLVSLIPRFYDVTSGRVTIDGIDVRNIPLPTLRSIVGVCQQEPVLLSGSIKDTITFSDSSIGHDRMVEIAKAADSDGFIEAIPGDYDSYVARRGANFSGGQRQRLSIARTLAKSPKILILDDSTSACDVVTEANIQDSISRMMAGVTLLIVAQRISSVITADRILVMDKGRIIAQGTHNELLLTCTQYREIYESQLGTLPTGQGVAA